MPGRSDPESHDLSVPVDFTERAGGSPLRSSTVVPSSVFGYALNETL